MNSIQIITHAVWESTAACNLRCRHCGLLCGRPQKDELTTEEVTKLFLELSQARITNLIISGGEFTLRPDWLELTKTALDHFASVRIITNGRLGKQLIEVLTTLPGLRRKRLILSVSVDGGDQETHNRRRGKKSFAKVLELLTAPTDIKKVVLTTVGLDNFGSLAAILKFALQCQVSVWVIQLALPAGRMKYSNFLGEKLIRALADQLARWQRQYGQQLLIAPDDCFGYLHPVHAGSWLGCHAGKRLIAILPNGAITGCPTQRQNILGQWRQTDLRTILNGEKLAALRLALPKTCQTCGRCPGGCQTVEQLFQRQFCLKPDHKEVITC